MKRRIGPRFQIHLVRRRCWTLGLAIASALAMVLGSVGPATAEDGTGGIVEEEVSFRSGAVTLRGTIFVPDGAASLPAVALVHGSGPGPRGQLRREAEAFAREGIAVLIYDKRTRGYSGSGLGERSYDLLADDALAAVGALRRHPAVDPGSVGLWGLSEGGWVVPLAANRSDDVAFVVLVGASGVPPARQVSWYLENELRHRGVSGSMVGAVARTGIRVQAGTGGMAEADHDHVRPLERLRQPVLALWGEKDRVVPPAESARVFQAALRSGRTGSRTIRFFPEAQHGLEYSPDGYTRSETLVRGYPEMVAGWIREVSRHEAPAPSADPPPPQPRISRPLEPLAWWESGWVQLGAMAVPILAFGLYVAATLGAALAHLLRGRKRGGSGTTNPLARRWARCAAVGGLATMLGFVLYFGFLLSTAGSVVGPVVAGRALPWLTLQALAAFTCVAGVLLAASWWRTPRKSTTSERTRNGVVLLGGVVFAMWAAYWGLLTP